MPRVDPYRSFNFYIELDGITQAGFQECSGLSATVTPTEYREGNEAPTVRKLPTMTTYSNITLKWGLTDSTELFDWFAEISKGVITRKNGSIVLIDIDGTTEKARWNFYQAWPTQWDAASLNATANEVAIETLQIAHERLERA